MGALYMLLPMPVPNSSPAVPPSRGALIFPIQVDAKSFPQLAQIQWEAYPAPRVATTVSLSAFGCIAGSCGQPSRPREESELLLLLQICCPVAGLLNLPEPSLPLSLLLPPSRCPLPRLLALSILLLTRYHRVYIAAAARCPSKLLAPRSSLASSLGRRSVHLCPRGMSLVR